MNTKQYFPSYGSMTKSELATLYFPESSLPAARRKLNTWIARNKQLSAELERTGYVPRNILLTPAQVGLVVQYLGEP